MINNVAMKKEEVRRQVRARKALLSQSERMEASDAVFDMLEKTAAFLMSDNILMYHSLPDELDTHRFLDKWAARKRFFLPRVNGLNLEILPYDKSSLRLGAFHIEEPDGTETASVREIDLIIVPGVGYDPDGNRVGRGKGYYDRLLSESRATKIGVAYDFQVVDSIDCEPHDIGVDIVITDTTYYHTASRRKIVHHPKRKTD